MDLRLFDPWSVNREHWHNGGREGLWRLDLPRHSPRQWAGLQHGPFLGWGRKAYEYIPIDVLRYSVRKPYTRQHKQTNTCCLNSAPYREGDPPALEFLRGDFQ
ncbi:MAG: hypothetical protein LAO04_01715 [Acidobacteriia bacterium]|nr:hypothetical protein [Terriglobia bacterium]